MPEKIYFTVLSNTAGITDSLDYLMKLRNFGLSLGYTYLHTPQFSQRSIGLLKVSQLKNGQLRNKIHGYINRHKRYNIWHFIGINPYFFAKNQTVKQQYDSSWKIVNLNLHNPMLKKKGISTIEELQRYAKTLVAAGCSPKNPCLLRLTGFDREPHLWPIIIQAPPAPVGELDLWQIYLAHSNKYPHRSRFKNGKLNMLVHLRMGDCAPIKTPWNTFLFYTRNLKIKQWEEYRDPNGFGQLTVTDFHDFIRRLTSCFNDGTFATVFSSDGFKKSFRAFNNSSKIHKHAMNITPKQIRALNKYRKHNEHEFNLLKSIKNSISIIGETRKNLFDFIHSALTADLIVTAFPVQHTGTVGLLFKYARYSRSKEMPTFILLYKPSQEKNLADRGLARNKKIIPVNIAAPDFDQVTRRLIELHPQIHNMRPANRITRS